MLRRRGLHRVRVQSGQDGGETLPRVTDSSIERLHRTTFCALKHTRSRHYPAVCLDSGLSFDASFKVHRGEDLALEVEGGRILRGTSSSSLGAGGGEGTSLQRKQGGGKTLLGTTNSSIGQLHCITLLCVETYARQSLPSRLFGQRIVVRCFFGST